MQAQNKQEPHEDGRFAVSRRFIEDDEFVKTSKFKYFWVKMKMREFEERVQMKKMGANESQRDEIVTRTFKELRINEIDIILDGTRRMVLRSDMLIILGMEVQKV